MGYHTKYDEHNAGTQYVFDMFYRMLANSKIKSNLVACPGKDVDRYIRYASMVCRASKARAYFFENAEDHLKIIRGKLKKSQHPDAYRVRIRQGDVITHESFGGPKVARIEDLGLGIGIRGMLYQAMTRLYRQSRAVTANSKWNAFKVQILDSCTRGVPPEEWYQLYKQYLSVIGLEMFAVNGIDVEEKPHLFAKFNYGTKVFEYKDGNRGTCAVYRHDVELYPNKYEKAKLHLYSCINGSSMLQSMLVYK